MSDCNFIGGVVRILELPAVLIGNNEIAIVKCRVQFPQVRNNTIVCLTFFGSIALQVADCYTIGDYILVEGYLSVRESLKLDFHLAGEKLVDIIGLKVYPIFLNSGI